jgi:hypothetical protein
MIELDNNNFTGPLPSSWIYGLKKLEFLNIQNNRFGGKNVSIPILLSS